VGLDADRLYETRSNSGAHLEQTRARFVSNMAKAIADQQKEMLRHLSILATRTTQEKILRFLYAYAHDTSSLSFTLPFSRQQMADYLCVDRSAMCTELYKLRAQGKLKVNMRHFELPPQSA
jgi:CRP-like cAMP-binding protein